MKSWFLKLFNGHIKNQCERNVDTVAQVFEELSDVVVTVISKIETEKPGLQHCLDSQSHTEQVIRLRLGWVQGGDCYITSFSPASLWS